VNRKLQSLCYFIAVLSFFGGLADIAIQYFEGQDIAWRIPIILIGKGVGLPIIIFPFYTPALPKDDSRDYDDNDVSKAFPDDDWLNSSSRGDLSSSSAYGEHGDYGDSD
jgi:hypothetical protein